ncbi:MAG: D-alanyl-D-alanine carboxypeptidase [Actinobacteria bacterium]|nr:D-alanyl-D-alanine carboxypeptidase [Actinomycetota bacterium]
MIMVPEGKGPRSARRKRTAALLVLLALILLAACCVQDVWATTSTSVPGGTTVGPAQSSPASSPTTDVTLPAAPDITGKAGILINMDGGLVLWEKNADERRSMASTTKIMTALLAIEHLDVREMVEASEFATNTGESEMLLEPGEVVPVEQLLYGIMVMSGNDAAVVAAEAVAGNVDAFVDMMNARAADLGLKDTRFANPHGLDAEGHYSTARDLAALGAYAMANPEFAKLAGTDRIEFPWPGREGNRIMLNHNKLVGREPFVTGIKTGFTNRAGFCLVGSGFKNGVNLVSVVLGTESSDICAQDTLRLLEYGFSLYREQVLVEKGTVLATIPIPYQINKKLQLATERGLVTTLHLSDVVSKSIDVPEMAPIFVDEGTALGAITFTVGDREVGMVELVTIEAVPRPTLGVKLSYFWSCFSSWLGGLFS